MGACPASPRRSSSIARTGRRSLHGISRRPSGGVADGAAHAAGRAPVRAGCRLAPRVRLSGERQLVGVATGTPGRVARAVASAASRASSTSRATSARGMPTRSSRAESDIAPTATPYSLIPTSGSVPATTGASTTGPSSGTSITIPTAPWSPAYHCSVWPSSGPSDPVHHHVGASLEGDDAPDAELDLPVDLLERVRRHDLGEWLVRTSAMPRSCSTRCGRAASDAATYGARIRSSASGRCRAPPGSGRRRRATRGSAHRALGRSPVRVRTACPSPAPR